MKKFIAVLLAVCILFHSEKSSCKCEAAQVAVGVQAGGAVGGPVGAVIGAAIGGVVLLGAVAFAAEHTKGKRNSTYDKHTKPRPGRPTTKNRSNPNWKPRNGKRP